MDTHSKKLPDGWIKRESTSRAGRFYYFNTKTGKTQWENPTVDKEKMALPHIGTSSKSDTHTKGQFSVPNAMKISEKSKDIVKKYKSKTPAQDRLQRMVTKSKEAAKLMANSKSTSTSPNKRKKISISKSLFIVPSRDKHQTMDFVPSFVNKDTIEVDCEQDVRQHCVDTHKHSSDDIPTLFPPKTPAQDRLNKLQPKKLPATSSPSQKNNDLLSVIYNGFGIETPVVDNSVEQMDCDEMMEWDDDETYSFEQLESMVIDIVSTDSAYVIPDTNVFLDSLQPIKRIIEKDQYSVLIPFVVLQELDQMKHKTNKLLRIKSSNAIRYIYNMLKMKNYRLQGQKATEDNDHIIEVKSPDDKILNCCLQLKNQSKEIILLTNDINLSNKALVNGIETITSHKCLETF
ncbi:transcriptional protein SWT1 [Contarinia nasturtii]|uniref:transcriptional protein SWT1 n=1 Tax=Contarinia nasturtii TaxID=265458 RepID=UPI0012D4A0C0|nr:transcriptional protein SWT1 [Contarinia nasturtii]